MVSFHVTRSAVLGAHLGISSLPAQQPQTLVLGWPQLPCCSCKSWRRQKGSALVCLVHSSGYQGEKSTTEWWHYVGCWWPHGQVFFLLHPIGTRYRFQCPKEKQNSRKILRGITFKTNLVLRVNAATLCLKSAFKEAKKRWLKATPHYSMLQWPRGTNTLGLEDLQSISSLSYTTPYLATG